MSHSSAEFGEICVMRETNTIYYQAVFKGMSKQILTSLATKSVLYGSEVVLGSTCGSSTLKETDE
jgi:hypothetical protein